MGPLPLSVVMTYSGSRTSWYREFPAMPACLYVRFGNICLVPASQATPSEAWNLHVRKICSLLLSGEKNLRRKFASLCRKDQAQAINPSSILSTLRNCYAGYDWSNLVGESA